MSSNISTSPTINDSGYAYKHFKETGRSRVSDNEPIKSWDLDPPNGDYESKYYPSVRDEHDLYQNPENITPQNDFINDPLTADYSSLNRNDDYYAYTNSGETEALHTRYSDEYKSYEHFDEEDLIMPRSQMELPNDQILLNSTYESNYQPYELEPTINYKPDEFYSPPQEPMDTQTSYRIDYPPRCPQTGRSYKPIEIYVPPLVPMLNKTSYQTEYQNPPPSPREIPFRMKDNETFPTGRFQSETTYIKDYQTKRCEPVHCFRPYREYQAPKEPMSDKTSYQMEYTPHPLSKPNSYAPNYVYHQPEQPFHKNTSYSEEFQPYTAPKTESFKPVFEYRKPKTKIEDTTAYRSDYRQWRTEKGYPYYPKDNLCLPQGKSDMTTSYMQEFQPRYSQRVQAIKPKENKWRSDEALSTQTSYLTDFRPLTPQPSMSYKPIEIYKSPSLPLVTHSSYTEDYVPRCAKKREPVLPIPNLKTSKLPMEKNTSYSEEFQYRKAKKPENLKPTYQYTHPKIPFSGKTSYQIEFPPPPRKHKHNQSCPPHIRYSYIHPTTKMDTTTSYTHDFKPIHNPTKLRPILKQDNTKINKLLDHNLKTSYSIDYANPYQSDPNPSKSRKEHVQQSQMFHTKPNSSGDSLPKINVHSSHRTMPKNNLYMHYEDKIDNHYLKTTYQQEYSKLPPIQQAASSNQFRPQDYYIPPKIKMSNKTTYSSDFKWPHEFMTCTEGRELDDFTQLSRPHRYANNNISSHDQYFNNTELTYTQLSNRTKTITHKTLPNNSANINDGSNTTSGNSHNNNNNICGGGGGNNNNESALGKFMNLMSKNTTD
ncbi:unnamed protein product [Trichobilharzia szidati]|nr:unnamed protein product [Trichobilharzia szidati]